MTKSKVISPKLLFIGFGNVGRKAAEILVSSKDKYPNLAGFNPSIVGIFTKTRGAVVNQNGLHLEKNFNEFEKNSRFSKHNPDYSEMSVDEAIKNLDYNILVELTTLSIEDKGEPAVSNVTAALNRGKHVVSANKGPAAFAYQELHSLAQKNNSKFLFESAVMDGAPIFNLYRNNLKGCKVKGLSGILNSTTNFIFSEMESGKSFEHSLREAQRLGFVEADYANDIDGWDAAAKLSVLTNALLDVSITPFDVLREGIRGITPGQVQNAYERGYHLKLVCRAFYKNEKLITRVAVEEVPDDHIFSKVTGSGSVLRIETDLMNPIMIVQENPSLIDTAYGVLSDLLEITATA